MITFSAIFVISVYNVNSFILEVTTTAQDQPRNLRISPSIRSYNRPVGSSLSSISCSADCEPTCSYEWIFPDGTTGSSNILSISRIEKGHNGTFTCKVENSVGSGGIGFSLDVQYPPETVQMSPSTSVVTVREFQTSTITCSATCRPECSYSWQRRSNGLVVSKSSQLLLSSLNRTLAGDYYCHAFNSYGSKDSSTISIIIHTLPTTVDKFSVICTGPESASISWIPDLTVVPEQNFTISYWPSLNGQSQRMTKMYVIDTSHQYIYIMYLDGLVASTGYSFQILADNGIGKRWSNVRACSTFKPLTVESAASPELTGGITMMTIAALIIVAVVILFVLRRLGYGYEIFNICGIDLSCCKRKKVKPENDYVNIQGLNPDDGEKDEVPYQDLQRSRSKKDETKPYDRLQVTSAVNIENKSPVDQSISLQEILSTAKKVKEKKDNPYANVNVANVKNDKKGKKLFNLHKQPIKPPITKPKPKKEK